MTHNGNEEETEMKNFEDEDNMGEKYDLEEVRLMIQEQVREHYANLEDTIRTFFPSNKVTILNSADLKIIESFFVYELMDCAKEEAAEFFTEKIKKKNDYMNNFVILSYELSTFEDIRRCDLVPSDGKGYCYLRPTLIEVKSSENRCILEVIGGLISMKKITEDFEKNKKIYNIEEVRIIAAYMLQIDCNLDNSIWHGINVVIKATNVEIMGVYTWDLSGISSNERYKKAKGGQEHGDAGEDGVDGPAGESAGNLLMLADRVTNAEKLMVLLNGGNASSGQDGGDGVDGQDGTGLCKDVLLKDYPPTAKLEQGVKSNEDRIILVQNTIINFGKVGTKWIKWNSTGEKFDNYLEVEMADQKITFSGGWYWVYQAFFLHEGSEGKPGGLGGQQGLGGDAGFKGDCLAVCPKNNRSISINAKRKGGEKGADGKPGRNGEWGKNGWDTGWIDHQFWTNPVYYGDNKNMKLKLCYSRNSSSDKVYCPYRYEELGLSDYYVELLELKLEHKYLNDHEKVPEHVDRRKQKAAIATRKNTISKKKIEQNYSKFFESDTALSQEIDKTQAEEKNGYSALQNKANEVFEEVEKAKERSREKKILKAIHRIRKRGRSYFILNWQRKS
uniref:Uncharacterized protein n=1 Tax=Plectus sambesii TaxID=2011161 RepID=A0A914VYH3_9BILA